MICMGLVTVKLSRVSQNYFEFRIYQKNSPIWLLMIDNFLNLRMAALVVEGTIIRDEIYLNKNDY